MARRGWVRSDKARAKEPQTHRPMRGVPVAPNGKSRRSLIDGKLTGNYDGTVHGERVEAEKKRDKRRMSDLYNKD